jgi:hypothetical protein
MNSNTNSYDDNDRDDHDVDNDQHDHNSRMIDATRKAIDDGDISFLDSKKEFIKKMFEQNSTVNFNCSCGCPSNYSLFTKIVNPPTEDFYSKPLPQIQSLFLRSILFLLSENIIDVDRIYPCDMYGRVGKNTFLSSLLKNYIGHDFERHLILIFIKKASPHAIRDFRDMGNATMLYMFANSYAYDDAGPSDDHNVAFCIEVRNYLLATDIDLTNVATYDDGKHRSMLTISVRLLSIFLVQKCLDQGVNPNLILNESIHGENVAMLMLFIHRYTHNQDIINDIAKILALLIQSGLNLNYCNEDNRNISDYCTQYCFSDTPVGHLLSLHNAPAPTGNTFIHHDNHHRYILDLSDDPYLHNPIVQLLVEYRFLKDPQRLDSFYTQFETLTVDTLPKHNGYYDNLYNYYVNKYNWNATRIEKHIAHIEEQIQQRLKEESRHEKVRRCN